MALDSNEKNERQEADTSSSNALHQDLMSTDHREALRIVQAQRNTDQPAAGQGPGKQQQAVDDKPAGGDTSAGDKKNGAQQPPDATKVNACKESPDYIAFIEGAAETMYDPQKLGNLKQTLHKYDCDIKTPADAVKKAEEVLEATKDPYNHIMSPQEVAQLRAETQGNYTGIGVEIVGAIPGKSDYPKLKDVIDGAPAKAAGLAKGDQITSVDGHDARGMTTQEIMNALLGAEHTKVNLTVLHNGNEVHDTIERAKIESHAITGARDLGDGIAYISIHDFANEKTAAELQQAMQKFPDAKGFVIDVRDNPGGLVDQAVAASELFIDKGVIMKEKQRGLSEPTSPQYIEQTYGVNDQRAYVKEAFSDDPEHPHTRTEKRLPNLAHGRPVVVLTNEDSASAAEIFTGALHDTAHATTLGDKTYGKGIGQSILSDMPEGTALKVTTLHYTTPSGIWPGDANQNRIGLKPDVAVKNPEDTDAGSPQDAQLKAAVDLLKKKFNS